MSQPLQIFKSQEGGSEKGDGKSRGQQAKDLLAKYGIAYIGTSVSLSLVSITVCYLLINSGVDVASLLEKVRGTWRRLLLFSVTCLCL